MNNECRYEQEILHSVKTGQWNAYLHEHVTACPICKEMLTISKTLKTVQNDGFSRAKAIPAYKYIWLRSQFQRREERLTRLDLVKLLGSSFIGALALIAIVFWKIPALSKGIKDIFSNGISDWVTIIPIGIPLSFAIVTLIAIWVYSLEFYKLKR